MEEVAMEYNYVNYSELRKISTEMTNLSLKIKQAYKESDERALKNCLDKLDELSQLVFSYS